MEVEQIVVLTSLFSLSFLGYWFFNRRFEQTPHWVRHNLMFLSFGITGALAFAPFIYPYSFWKNLPVFTIIPLCSFNSFYFVNGLFANRRIGRAAREIIEIVALVSGAFVGMFLINFLQIGIFNQTDMVGIVIITFLFSIGRILYNYSTLEKIIRKSHAELKDSRMRELLTKQQLEILHNKINPHFLYNSLNSIAALAMIDGKKTKEMTIGLSKLLRYSLNYAENNFASLGEEVETIETYLAVEKIRFEECLTYEINLSDKIKGYLIPRFLLQPIVENCFKHAFNQSETTNFIGVDIYVVEGQIVIIIRDSGVGFPDKLTPGYGFQNVTNKLQLLLPGKHEFHISNSPQKHVKIVIKGLIIDNEPPA
jgi:sensor histidine kinase YesM